MQRNDPFRFEIYSTFAQFHLTLAMQLNPSNDSFLLKKVKDKDKVAFDELFRLYYSQLSRFSYNIVRDKSIAEEIVQEFFISLWEQTPMVTDSVKSYFFRSIYNRSLNYLEKVKTRTRNEETFATEQDQHTESEPADEEQELHKRVSQAVDELPDKCKEIFMLCKYQEMSYSEVSELLNISPKTVENQMGIALKKLRERLLPFWIKK